MNEQQVASPENGEYLAAAAMPDFSNVLRSAFINKDELPAGLDFSKAVVDVGANNGAFSHEFGKLFPHIPIIAIEPIPELAAKLWRAAKSLGVTNIAVMQLGVDEHYRKAQLNVARHADWGVSSLLEFNTENLENDPYWKRRSDLYHEDSITIETVPLSTILDAFAVKNVEFIKVDTQGFDMRVMRSMGPHLKSLRAGMVEAASCDYTRLYSGGEETLQEILPELQRLGQKVYAIKPNDRGANEYNVYFHGPGVDWQNTEQELRLLDCGIYGGKYYWNNPSNRL